MKSLLDGALLKGVLSAALTALASLLAHDPQLVVLVVLLVSIDAVTGCIAAARRGERITSSGLRQTIVKVLEYALFLVAAVAAGSAFDLLSWLGDTAYFYVSLTELKSIAENSSNSPFLKEAAARIKAEIDRRTKVSS